MGQGADHHSLVITIVRQPLLILLNMVITALALMSDRCPQFWVCDCRHLVLSRYKVASP